LTVIDKFGDNSNRSISPSTSIEAFFPASPETKVQGKRLIGSISAVAI